MMTFTMPSTLPKEKEEGKGELVSCSSVPWIEEVENVATDWQEPVVDRSARVKVKVESL